MTRLGQLIDGPWGPPRELSVRRRCSAGATSGVLAVLPFMTPFLVERVPAFPDQQLSPWAAVAPFVRVALVAGLLGAVLAAPAQSVPRTRRTHIFVHVLVGAAVASRQTRCDRP